MTVSRNRILLVVAGVLVVGCIGLAAWAILRDSSAAAYGMTDRTRAALVVQNKSNAFYILGVSITGADGQSVGLVEDASRAGYVFPILPGERIDEFNYEGGERGVFVIEPGDYTLEVEYSDHASLAEISEAVLYVHKWVQAEFSAAAGRAVVFTLAGGSQIGGMYEPPELFGP